MRVFVLSDGFVAVANDTPRGVELSIPDLSGAHMLLTGGEDVVQQATLMRMVWLEKAEECGLHDPEGIPPVSLAETQRLLGKGMVVPMESEGE
jgi:hypothetical protein